MMTQKPESRSVLAGGPVSRSGPCNAAIAALPWQAHGALRVSPDRRQLCHADGTPFFWLGDTAWEIATRMRLDAESADGRGVEWYLSTRAAQGFNVIQMPLITPLGWIAGRNVQGDSICRCDGFSADRLNDPFLKRFDSILDAATACGLFVAVLPAWAENVANGSIDVVNAGQYGAILGRRYGHRLNVIWNLGGDYLPTGVEHVWDAMARGILAGAGPDARPLFTYHPKGHQSSSAYALGDWMSFDSVQSSHTDPKNEGPTATPEFNAHFDLIARDYARIPHRPTINTEPPYEDITLDLVKENDAPRLSLYDLRLAAYWSVLGGAAGHTYGHNSLWQAWDPADGFVPQFGARNAWQDVLEAPGVRELHVLRALVLSRPLAGRVRDDAMIENFDTLRTGRTAAQAVACRGEDYALLYSGNGSPLSVRMGRIRGREIAAWWFDPTSGESAWAGTFANAGTQTFTPPSQRDNGHDWVLALSDADGGYPAPGTAITQPLWPLV
ncbi:MAG: putative endoglucanase [Phycisphaerales bacterium]|nr:putative endoglucanase [Phycisphaerales bacterium]